MTRRVCLLTGASGVVGSAFIRRHAERYAIVAVHHRSHVRCASQHQSFVDPFSPSGPVAANRAIHAICTDLSRADAVDALIREVTEVCGTVDVLIHAAAVRTSSSLVVPGGLDLLDAAFAVNVMAPLRLATGLGRVAWQVDPDSNVRANRNVINVLSTAGLFVYEDMGQAIHSASQAALGHLTYHLASELWHIGIRVNAIALGLNADRDMIDATADQLAELDGSSRTGQIERVGDAS